MRAERSFGIMRYNHGVWDGANPIRLDAQSHEMAIARVCGDDLTLIECPRIRSLYHLVGKVWSGDGYRYAYRFPTAK
jgi:hypothetical protein